MPLSRRIARPLLASIFVVGGLDAVRHPAGKAKKAEVVSEPLSKKSELVPSDPETLVRINGGIQIGAGLLLATGAFRRLAALTLIGSIIPTTYAGHRFWEETDQATRAEQKIHFLKNLGLLGGLILVTFDREGEASLGRGAKRRARHAEAALSTRGAGGVTARPQSETASIRTSQASRRAIRQASTVGRRAKREVRAVAADSSQKIADGSAGLRQIHGAVKDAVRESSEVAVQAVQQATSVVADAARQFEPIAQTAARSGLARTTDLLSKLSDQVPTH